MITNLNVWREASSLILTAKTAAISPAKFNYQVLCLKRNPKSKFLPGSYVFPGGNLSKIDDSQDWLHLYENFGFNQRQLNKLNLDVNVPPILNNNITNNNKLPRYLSLRLCAIRETFEECGILICKGLINNRQSNWTPFNGNNDLINKWQRKVNENPNEFYNLCVQLKVYPDIWSLHCWSNWVTPKSRKIKFDTIFFLCNLNEPIASHIDGNEIHESVWANPDEHLEKYNEHNNFIMAYPPPQLYEITRLHNIKDADLLEKFAKERANKGCETYLPCEIRTNRRTLLVLPGDDLYPEKFQENPVYTPDIPFMDEIPNSRVKNRIYLSKTSGVLEIENFQPKIEHLVPVISQIDSSNRPVTTSRL